MTSPLKGGNGTTDVLRQQRIEVKLDDSNTLVELHIGEQFFKMDHNAALQISAWLRLVGTQAKRRCGDFSRTITAIGFLEDAEEAYKKGWK